jgi:hypothetical protein
MDMPLRPATRDDDAWVEYLFSAHLDGRAREVAELVAVHGLPRLGERPIKDAIKIALAQELTRMDKVHSRIGSGELVLGWTWPEATFVTGAVVYLYEHQRAIGRQEFVRPAGSRSARVFAHNVRAADDKIVDHAAIRMSLFLQIQKGFIRCERREIPITREDLMP